MDPLPSEHSRSIYGHEQSRRHLASAAAGYDPAADPKLSWELAFFSAGEGDADFLRGFLSSPPPEGGGPFTFAGLAGNAALFNHPDCLSLLLDAGVAPDAAWGHGIALLHSAVRGGSAACIGLLADAGATLGLLNAFGCSPATEAASLGHVDCLLALSAAGADLSLPDSDGRTPLAAALKSRRASAAALLETAAGIRAGRDRLAAAAAAPSAPLPRPRG